MFIIFIFICGFLFFCFFAVCIVLYELPSVNNLDANFFKSPTIVVRDCNEEVIFNYGNLQGTGLSAHNIPKNVEDALIASEDQGFWYHRGFNWRGISRAVYVNVINRKFIEGGSSISQQLAKQIIFDRYPNIMQRTFVNLLMRKIREVIFTIKIEQALNKKQILQHYLNRVYFGNGAYGITSAAWRFFGRHPEELSVYEAAMLVGFLQAPSVYSSSQTKAIIRAKHVLRRMVNCGYISEDYMEAICFTPPTMMNVVYNKSILHFSNWILTQIPTWIKELNIDIDVVTTLNPAVQEMAQQAIDTAYMECKERNYDQASLVSFSHDGAIIAMIGGRSYVPGGWNRVVESLRQQGSLFKFFIFMTALRLGCDANSIIEDTPPAISDWSPSNYFHIERGFVTLERAFAQSINGATMRLAMLCGATNIYNTIRKCGITTSMSYTNAISLGNAEASLFELTKAFGVIANRGCQIIPYGITQIRKLNGEVIWNYEKENLDSEFDELVICKMWRLLRGVITDAKGTGRSIKLPFSVAGKTGTSQKYRDLWFIGISPRFVTGSWCGNDNDTPMNETGGNPAIVAWKKFVYDVENYYEINDEFLQKWEEQFAYTEDQTPEILTSIQ